jgi:hypothetical protein
MGEARGYSCVCVCERMKRVCAQKCACASVVVLVTVEGVMEAGSAQLRGRAMTHVPPQPPVTGLDVEGLV